MDNSDTGIIGGMSKLVNQKNIKEGVDPQEIEDQLVKRPPTQDPKYDGMNKFISSLKDTAEDAGVEISSVSEAPPAPLQITNILNENLGRSKLQIFYHQQNLQFRLLQNLDLTMIKKKNYLYQNLNLLHLYFHQEKKIFLSPN